MREFQEKRRIRRALYSKTSLVIVFILVALLTKATWGVYQKAKESKNNSQLTKNELETLQTRHDFLQGQIDELNTTAGKEREIRQDFQVAKEGEQIVVIVDATSSVNTQAEEQNSLQKAWNSFLNIFKKKKS